MLSAIPPNIKRALEQTKQILVPWTKLKDTFAKEIVRKDFVAAEKASNALLHLLYAIYQLYTVDIKSMTVQKDWRSDDYLRRRCALLLRRHDRLTDHVKHLDVKSYIQDVERAEKNIASILSRAAILMNEGSDSRDPEKRHSSRSRIGLPQSQKEQKEEWKAWAKTYRSAIEDEEDTELVDILNEYRNHIREREQKKKQTEGQDRMTYPRPW